MQAERRGLWEITAESRLDTLFCMLAGGLRFCYSKKENRNRRRMSVSVCDEDLLKANSKKKKKNDISVLDGFWGS